MKKRSTLFFGLAIFLLSTSCQQQSENPLTDLREEGIHSLNMFLYPSTIRMINIANDSSFYQATKDIREIQYLSINLADSAKAVAYASWFALQKFEEWDELMRANIDGNSSVVYSPQNSEDKFFASMRTASSINLLWAEGGINLSEAMNVMNNGLDLGPITDYLDNSKMSRKRSEVWKKAREEQKKLEEENSSEKEKSTD